MHDSSAESVTPKVNPTPCNDPPNLVPNVPDDPDSDPSLSDFPSANSSESSDDDNFKQRRCTKKNKKKRQGKKSFNDTIKKCAKFIKLITETYKSKGIKLKLDEDPLQFRVYLLSLTKPLKIFHHNLSRLKCWLWTIHP